MKSKKRLVEYLLEHHVDEDGDVDISGLDFGEFEGDVDISGIKSKGDIFQGLHKNNGHIEQSGHENDGNVWQYGHRNEGNIWQGGQRNEGNIWQSGHKNLGIIQKDYENNGKIFEGKIKNSQKNKHYKAKIEPIKFMEENFTKEEYVGFCKGNVIKYISRFDKKGTPVDDLEKAKVYIDYILKNLQED